MPNIDMGSVETADAEKGYFTKYVSVAEATQTLADMAAS